MGLGNRSAGGDSRPIPSSVYAFGDGHLAGDRLGVLAKVFTPATRNFLTEFGLRGVDIALDLGCGPGHTTRLLSETLRPRQVVGLDSSALFVKLARRLHRERRLRFLKHDVTRTPLPFTPADLIYVRFLLAHLTEPEDAVALWAQQLRSNGRLLVEEVETIETGEAVLATYLELVTGMLAARGQVLAVGPRLAKLRGGIGWTRHMSRLVPVNPTTGEAARMFWLNLQSWRADPYISTRVDTNTLDALDAGLHSLANSDDRNRIRWRLRQLVFARKPA